MRYYTALILCALFAAPLCAIPVRWSTDYEKARTAAAEDGDDMFVWLSRRESRHANQMLSRVWPSEALSDRLHRNWLPVHVVNPDLRMQDRLGQRSLPAVVIVAPDGEVRARRLISDWEQPGDVEDWLDVYDETIEDLENRVNKAAESPRDYEANLALARACVEIGRPGMGVTALSASLDELSEQLKEEQEASENEADWDEEVVERQRECALTMALALTRESAVLGSGRNRGLVSRAVEIYEEHEDWLSESSSEHAVHAAILLAYRDFLDERPESAFRRVDRIAVRIPMSDRRVEVNYWAGFYAWKSGDTPTARARLRRVIGFGPSYHPSVEAAENFLQLLR